MKSQYLYFTMLLLATVSCARLAEETIEQDVIEEQPVVSQTFDLVVNATIPEDDAADSKVTITEPTAGTYKMNWDATGETAMLVEGRLDGWNTVGYNTTSAVKSGDKMTFSFSSISSYVDQPKGFSYYIFYPQTAVTTGSISVVLNLKPNQVPAATSPDASAALLYGFAGKYVPSQPEAGTSMNATFGHLAAYCRIKLKDVPSSETISTITVTAEDYNIAGDLTYSVWDDTKKYDKSTVHTITLDGINLTADPAGFDVWFACKPFTLEAGHKLTVETTTDANVYKSVLQAKADMLFEAGYVTSFPATADNAYAVTFESNGGTDVAPVFVKKGQTLSEPTAPTKAETITEGFYEGDIADADDCSYIFGGWYTDSGCTTPYNFSAPVSSDLTLYAKWTGHTKIDLSGYPNASSDVWNAGSHIPNKAIRYLADLGDLADETNYTIVMNSNCTIWKGEVNLNKPNAVVRWIGKGAERTITTSNDANVLLVNSGTLILGKNILLKFNGSGTHSLPLISLFGSTAIVILEDGCRIDGTKAYTNHLVSITEDGAKFIMNGGSISNNVASSGNIHVSPIYVGNGSFNMNGGTISNNSVELTSDTSSAAGAIMFSGWYGVNHDMSKTGGTIVGNSTSRTVDVVAGYRGEQVLLLSDAGKPATASRHVYKDADIDANDNGLTGNSYAYWWAVAETK